MIHQIKKITVLLTFVLLLTISIVLPATVATNEDTSTHQIIVSVDSIRTLEDVELYPITSFQMRITIDSIEFISPKWSNSPYLYDIGWVCEYEIPEGTTLIPITMELYNENQQEKVYYDLKGESTEQNLIENVVDINYDVLTGHWTGDDFLNDASGYGRLNGCDDGSIYTYERDCEILFSIVQPDNDNDFIPTWIEEEVYHSNPNVDDSLSDPDEDGCPTTWEWKWGYDPNTWDDHNQLDPDADSISNKEEQLTSIMNSDPFRKDVFLQLDFMADGPNGEKSVFPDASKDIIKNPFHRRNIMFHIDTGIIDGGEFLPFKEHTNNSDHLRWFQDYFLDNDEDSWKRGVFHFGIYVYETSPKGYAFSGDVEPFWGYHPGTNCYVISSSRMERNYNYFPRKSLEYYYAAATMHEMGHNFGFRWGDPFGCDAQLGKYPWQINYWLFGSYKSLMNYRYTYKIFDYSDGTHGPLDHDDWSNLDFSYFEIPT